MLDEEMDHIIREAADKHHPAYNDKAWEKMEQMLDKHLPQKRDGRKFIFFLLFFLLLGGGIVFSVINLNSSSKTAGDKLVAHKPVPQTGADQSTIQLATTTTTSEQEGLNSSNQLSSASDKNITTSKLTENSDNKNNVVAGNFVKTKRSGQNNGRSKTSTITGSTDAETIVAVAEQNGKQKRRNTSKQKNYSDKSNIVITSAAPESDETESSVQEALQVIQDSKPESTEEQKKKDEIKPAEDKKEKQTTETKPLPSPEKKKAKKNVAGNFGLTFSVGPDLSFVKLNKLGKATINYGAGISYNVSKRFTVKAGFYVAKKIYSAAPDEYHFPGGASYPYLYSVDADCKVYEIPVSVSYNFGQKKNHSWFAGAGISSLLMKTEDYEYLYKVPSGQTYKYYREVKNQNNHYFSTITLSGGYQYNLGKRVSIAAEPYVKIPLSGIGLGKIKLNSTGVLFSVVVRPFARK